MKAKYPNTSERARVRSMGLYAKNLEDYARDKFKEHRRAVRQAHAARLEYRKAKAKLTEQS